MNIHRLVEITVQKWLCILLSPPPPPPPQHLNRLLIGQSESHD